MQQYHHMPSDSDLSRGGWEPPSDSPTAGRLGAALVTAVLVQYAWAAVCLWQLQEPLFQLCFMDACEPIDRPLRDKLLLIAIPVLGPLLSLVTALSFGHSLRRVENWLIFLFVVPFLALAIPVALILVLLVVAVILTA